MYKMTILFHMKVTIHIDDDLLDEARKATGIQQKTSLIRAGLESLVAREAARRLAALGGCDPHAKLPRRRRPFSKP